MDLYRINLPSLNVTYIFHWFMKIYENVWKSWWIIFLFMSSDGFKGNATVVSKRPGCTDGPSTRDCTASQIFFVFLSWDDEVSLAWFFDVIHGKSGVVFYTSSTAQGGGGSFKNRKPIGEVGCCESGMAERSHWLTERWLELCLLEWLQWLQWCPHPQLLDVVWCTATVVVVVA